MTELPLAYCERLLSGAEPVNVLSNLGYAAVAVWLLRTGSSVTRRVDAAALFGIAAFSALFHAQPSLLTQLLDVLAIALALALLMHRALRHGVGTTPHAAALIVVVWVVTSAVLSRFPTVLSGSLLYAPTLAVLVVLYARMPGQCRSLAATLALLCAALLLRTLDRPMCGSLPYGLHVFWHLFGAAALATFHRALDQVSTSASDSTPRL